MDVHSDPERIVADAVTIAKDAGLCFLVTIGDGEVDSRLMQPFEWRAGEPIWFGTSAASRKVGHVRETARAVVCYQSPSGAAYATVHGSIAIDADDSRRHTLWRPEWEAYFPGGPDGEDYTLLRFDPDRVEVLDFPAGIAPEPYGACAAEVRRTSDGWEWATAG